MTKAELREMLAFRDDLIQRETITAQRRIIAVLEREFGQMKRLNKWGVDVISQLFGVLEAHGIDQPLPPFLQPTVMH